jgi:hypothetical protein
MATRAFYRTALNLQHIRPASVVHADPTGWRGVGVAPARARHGLRRRISPMRPLFPMFARVGPLAPCEEHPMRRRRQPTVLLLAAAMLVMGGCSSGGRWGVFTFGHRDGGSTVASDAVGYNMARRTASPSTRTAVTDDRIAR